MKLEEFYTRTGAHDSLLIELPKGGYQPRFSYRPAALVASVITPPGPAKAARPRFVSSLALTAAGAALLVAGGIGWLKNKDPEILSGSSQTLTRLSGYQFNGCLSPDHRQVAFVWNGDAGHFNLYTREQGTGRVRQLTKGPGHDLTPSFSPDGKTLAFMRLTPLSRDLLLLSATGGSEHLLMHVPLSFPELVPDTTIVDAYSDGPAWDASGQFIAITIHGEYQQLGSVYLVNVKTGERKQVTFPPSQFGDYNPVLANDDRLAFLRTGDRANSADIYLLEKGAHQPRKLYTTVGRMTGLAWLGGHRLAFSVAAAATPGVFTLDINSAQVQPIDGTDRRASQPATTQDGRSMVYTSAFRSVGIWEQDIAAGPSTRARRVVASAGLEHSAQYSPDGQQIVFVSDRTGAQEIWKSNADGTDAFQLTSGEGALVGSPAWSPASDRIAYDTVLNGHLAIYTMRSDGRDRQLLIAGQQDYMMPTWSHDGEYVYYTLNPGSDAELSIWRKSIHSPNREMLSVGRGDILEAADGKSIYFCRAGQERGIWKLSLERRDSPPVRVMEVGTNGRYFAIGKNAFYYLLRTKDDWMIRRRNVDSGTDSLAAVLQGLPELGTHSLAISPDGYKLLFSQLDQSGSAIVLWNRTN